MHIGDRLIVFNRGLEALTYEVKDFNLEMQRKEG